MFGFIKSPMNLKVFPNIKFPPGIYSLEFKNNKKVNFLLFFYQITLPVASRREDNEDRTVLIKGKQCMWFKTKCLIEVNYCVLLFYSGHVKKDF